MSDKSNRQTEEVSDSVGEMFKHLPEIKQRDKETRRRTNTRSNLPKKGRLMQKRPDPAVLASNFEVRLEELENQDMVTHRAGKSWKSAKVALDTHSRLPIYYRLDEKVTHKGYIIDMAIEPDAEADVPDAIKENITEADTYGEHNDKYDKTNYLVTDGERLDEPFPQSELEFIQGGEYVDESFQYQPAYVRQREEDFPDF